MERTTNNRKKISKKGAIVVVVSIIAIILAIGCFIVTNNLRTALKNQKENEVDKASFYIGLGVGNLDLLVLSAYNEGGISEEEKEQETELLNNFLSEPSQTRYQELVQYINSLPYIKETVGPLRQKLEELAEDTRFENLTLEYESCMAGYLVEIDFARCMQEYERGNISEEELLLICDMHDKCTENPTNRNLSEYFNYVIPITDMEKEP